MAIPSARLMAAAVKVILDAHPTLTVYQSIVDPAPPLDDAGVLLGYAVFHPWPGNDAPNNLAGRPGQLLWGFQVTCAGGDTDYAMWAVDTVRGLLTGKTLTVAGTKVGLMRPPLGYQPPTRTELTVAPPRVEVPLQYQVLAAS